MKYLPCDSCSEITLNEIYTYLKLLLLLLFFTANEISLGGSSPYISTDTTNKKKCTEIKQYKNRVQTIQNTVNTSTRITKTSTQLSKHAHLTNPTYTRPQITKQVKTTTVQDTHQIK